MILLHTQKDLLISHARLFCCILFNQNKSPVLSCLRKKLCSSKVELNYNTSVQQTKSSVPWRRLTLRITSCLLLYDQVSVHGPSLNEFLLIFARVRIICPSLKYFLNLCHKLKDEKKKKSPSRPQPCYCKIMFLGVWAFNLFGDLQLLFTFEKISEVCYLSSAARYFSVTKT